MAAQITIRYYGPKASKRVLFGYELRVEAVAATDMPKEIFVFQRRVPSQTDAQANTLGDQFICVADPVDLEQYPVGAPDLLNNIPFYRTDSVRLIFRDMETWAETKTLMEADINRLVESLNVGGADTLVEEVVYA